MAADTWGNSWGGDVGPWLTSWSRVVTPAVEALGPTPAGRAQKQRRRFYVEVDGQTFWAESESHARAILDRAAELAAKAAEAQAEEIVGKRLAKSPLRRVAPVKIAAPRIETSAPVDLSGYQRRIDAAYAEAARLAELRLMIERQQAIEEEEEALLLLM